MAHLIDKDEVLAIIENRIRACGNCYILEELTSLHRTFDSLEVKEVGLLKEPVSEGLEKELSRLLKDCEIDSEYIHQDFLHIVANHFADWQKEQMMAKAVDVTIAIPYSNGYGSYTQLVDSKEALPFGEKVKVLVIKED